METSTLIEGSGDQKTSFTQMERHSGGLKGFHASHHSGPQSTIPFPKLNNFRTCFLKNCWPAFAPTTQSKLIPKRRCLISRTSFNLALSLPFPHSLSLCCVFHLFSKLTNEEDKEWGGIGRGGWGEWDTELIRLEKHAGLNTANEHYKGFKLCLWGFVREVTHDTAGSSVQVRVRICLCARMCVKLTKVK